MRSLAIITAVAGRFVSAGDATAISGPGSCIVTQQDEHCSLCVTDLVATAGGGAVYGEMKALMCLWVRLVDENAPTIPKLCSNQFHDT